LVNHNHCSSMVNQVAGEAEEEEEAIVAMVKLEEEG
jgi:hypothetical protein